MVPAGGERGEVIVGVNGRDGERVDGCIGGLWWVVDMEAVSVEGRREEEGVEWEVMEGDVIGLDISL